MKKILAWLLFLTMLLSSAAAEEAFVHGGPQLLDPLLLCLCVFPSLRLLFVIPEFPVSQVFLTG